MEQDEERVRETVVLVYIDGVGFVEVARPLETRDPDKLTEMLRREERANNTLQ